MLGNVYRMCCLIHFQGVQASPAHIIDILSQAGREARNLEPPMTTHGWDMAYATCANLTPRATASSEYKCA